MRNPFFILVIMAIFATSCKEKQTMNKDIQPPVAIKKDHKMEKHGDIRNDEYYWMNDREDQQVLDYLNVENDYYNKMTAHTKIFKNLYLMK